MEGLRRSEGRRLRTIVRGYVSSDDLGYVSYGDEEDFLYGNEWVASDVDEETSCDVDGEEVGSVAASGISIAASAPAGLPSLTDFTLEENAIMESFLYSVVGGVDAQLHNTKDDLHTGVNLADVSIGFGNTLVDAGSLDCAHLHVESHGPGSFSSAVAGAPVVGLLDGCGGAFTVVHVEHHDGGSSSSAVAGASVDAASSLQHSTVGLHVEPLHVEAGILHDDSQVTDSLVGSEVDADLPFSSPSPQALWADFCSSVGSDFDLDLGRKDFDFMHDAVFEKTDKFNYLHGGDSFESSAQAGASLGCDLSSMVADLSIDNGAHGPHWQLVEGRWQKTSIDVHDACVGDVTLQHDDEQGFVYRLAKADFPGPDIQHDKMHEDTLYGMHDEDSHEQEGSVALAEDSVDSKLHGPDVCQDSAFENEDDEGLQEHDHLHVHDDGSFVVDELAENLHGEDGNDFTDELGDYNCDFGPAKSHAAQMETTLLMQRLQKFKRTQEGVDDCSDLDHLHEHDCHFSEHGHDLDFVHDSFQNLHGFSNLQDFSNFQQHMKKFSFQHGSSVGGRAGIVVAHRCVEEGRGSEKWKRKHRGCKKDCSTCSADELNLVHGTANAEACFDGSS